MGIFISTNKESSFGFCYDNKNPNPILSCGFQFKKNGRDVGHVGFHKFPVRFITHFLEIKDVKSYKLESLLQ